MKSLVFSLGLVAMLAHARAPQPLNSSILLLGAGDFARCSQLVETAFELGNSRVNLVPTLHYVSDDGRTIARYCYARASACVPLTDEVIGEVREHLRACAATAFGHGMDLSVVPHLDDGGPTGMWRNDVVFDPLAVLEGQSYRDGVLRPMLDAIRAARPAGSRPGVDFAVQGEMGATLFHHPESYRQLLPWVRQMLSEFRGRSGVSFNFNKIGGTAQPVPPTELPKVQRLLDESDFVGISNYHSVSVAPVATDFSRGIDSVVRELAAYGLRLASRTEIQFSEMGIGGATTVDGRNVPARMPSEAAASPWAGSGRHIYDVELDPWATAVMRDFRYDYHRALLEFLTLQPDDFYVGAAYLWNMGSWDPQGLYFEGVEWEDARIIDLIRAHNQSLR